MINEELKKQIKVRSQVIGSIIIDSFFLLLWLIVTVFLAHLIDKVVTKYEFSGLDEKIFRIFQWLFSGSTFITVVGFLVTDIWTIFMKTKYKIVETSKKYRRSE